MGCCLSKTNPVHNPPLSIVEPESKSPPKNPPPKSEKITEISAVVETENKEEEQNLVKEEKKESLIVKEKEEFVNQPRKSHDKRSDSSDPESNNNPQTLATNIMAMAANGATVRTSSCTKEEVDAILIQCGRLSRSSSGKCGNSGSNRKYSGSKRSHDFDKESSNNNNNSVSVELNNCDENEDDERQRRRQSRGSHRRTTPSRSRERDPHSQKSGGGGRRLSQSPRKRSEATNNPSATTTTTSNGGNGNRPGKLVSVPATVSSMSMEKSNNGEGAYTNTSNATGNVKRVLVRRNVTPPRSRSPVVKNSSQNQPSPNRNPSRKAEHSPYRRTPLTDLDMNSLPFQPLANKSSSIKSQQKSNGEASVKQQPLNLASQTKGAIQGNHRRAKSRGGEGNDVEQLYLGPTIITRTRSQRRSRDLDVESLSNPKPATNYTSLLLQDIQNFHQKGSTTTTTSSTNVAPFKLPDCVSKACSIVEAVADLNLNSSTARTVGGRVKDDDLMEPSLQKFVTVGKGKEFDEREESSGSNSINGGGGGSQNQWVSSSASSWEMSSEGVSPASFQRIATTMSSNSRSGVSRSRAAGVGR